MKRERSYVNIVRNIIRYKHNSILLRNFGLVIIMMIMPFIILTLLVKSNLENVVTQEIEEVNDSSLEMVSKTLDTVLDKMFSFAYYLKSGTDFTLMYGMTAEEILEKYEDIYGKLMRMNILVEEYIDSVYVYLEDREMVLYGAKGESGMKVVDLEKMSDLSWLQYYESCLAQNEYYFLGSRVKNEHYPYLVTMVVPFQKNADRNNGAVVVNMDIKKLNEYLGYKDKNHQCFFMIGEEGQIYCTNVITMVKEGSSLPENLKYAWQEGASTGKIEWDGMLYIVSFHESENWHCSYVLCTPIEQFENHISSINSFIVQIVILISILAVIVAYIVTVHSFVPIQQIMNEIDRVDGEEEDISEENALHQNESYENEINYITSMVRHARKRNNRFHLETKKWMEKLNSAQMVALQSQINPHYLYNSLDMINWRAVELLGYNNTVSNMISTLAQFFRMGLQRTNYVVSISEEIAHAKLYTKILEERYRGSIHVEWAVDEEVMSCETVRLTLQPLIENAINHGLRPKRYEGKIMIGGGVVGDFVYLSVEDNGVGIEEEECVALNYELINHYDEDSTHIGIRNVNQRIKIMFGDEYGVNLRSNTEGGLKVSLLLPGKKDNGKQENEAY